MAINQVVAQFVNGETATTALLEYQYDIEQYLLIEGLNLPFSYEVDFCNDGDATTVTMIGDASGVLIPRSVLATGRIVNAYIVLTDGNSVQTRYKITIPVHRRPSRVGVEPTPAERTTIDTLIEALNEGVEYAEDAKDAAQAAQTAAETAQGHAEDAQSAAETAQGHAEDAQTAAEAAQSAAEGAQTGAENARDRAEAAQSAAETAQGLAEAAQTAAESAESGAETNALKAEGYAVGTQNGVEVASGSPYYNNNAEYYNGQAAEHASDANTAKTAAQDAKTAAETAQGKAETAQGKAEDAQTAAETAQGKAEDAQTAAETAQGKAEAAEQAILDLTASATVNSNVGTPAVTVNVTEQSGHKNMAFAFSNLKGDAGYSPSARVSKSGSTATISVTDQSGTTTASVNDGITPEVDVTAITGGHRITITDKDHPSGQSFDVMDGTDGITPTVSVSSIAGGHNVAFDYGSGDPRNTDFDVMDGEVSSADLQAVADAKAPVIVDHAEGSIVSVVDGADGMPLKECVVGIEPVQSGSGDPSPDNVRPISGWTGANVTRTGKNLFDKTAYTVRDISVFSASGVAQTRSGIYIYLPKGTYTLCAHSATVQDYVYVNRISQSGAFIENKTMSTSTSTWTAKSFTLEQGDYLALFKASDTLSLDMDLQIETGSSATAYEPYTGTSLSIPFGQTVRGGNVKDNGDGTWTLTVTKSLMAAATRTWEMETNGTKHIFYTTANSDISTAVFDVLCNKYKTQNTYRTNLSNCAIGYYNNTSKNRISIRDDSIASKDDFVSSLSDIQIVYRRATALTYTITAQQLITLYGLNNIWSDTGDTSIDYCCDTKLFIEKLTAPTEDDLIADHAISSGTFFMTTGNSLYLATANIANGAQIIEGTNATKLSLADALNTINS